MHLQSWCSFKRPAPASPALLFLSFLNLTLRLHRIHFATHTTIIPTHISEEIQPIKMPAQEVNQPQSQQMEMAAQDPARVSSEQPVRFPFPPNDEVNTDNSQRQSEQMTAEPVSMRGGGEGGDICCGL